MDGGDLSHLEGVEHQADVTMSCKPNAIGLVPRLIAVSPNIAMAAQIEHGGQAFSRFDVLGSLEVTCHV